MMDPVRETYKYLKYRDSMYTYTSTEHKENFEALVYYGGISYFYYSSGGNVII